MSESLIIIDPKVERRPTLPPGTYGADGEVELRRLRGDTVKFGKNKGQPCINMQVAVNTAEYGVVSIFKDWAVTGPAKKYTLRMLENIGVDMAARDSEGNLAFNGADFEGQKVIVTLTESSWPEQGEPGDPDYIEAGSKNYIDGVTRRV